MVRWPLVALLALAAACAPAGPAAPPQAAPVGTSPPTAAPDDDAPLADLATWERWRGADYVAIAPRSFLPALAPLAAHRESQGHVVALLAVEDLFARFSSGRTEARAVEEAVRRLGQHTEGKLRFVLLVGDARNADVEIGSTMPTFYREKLTYQNGPPVDPLAYPSSAHEPARYPTDRPYATAIAKSAPLAVGRVPARTVAEVDAFVKKEIAYETGPAPGSWSRRLSLFAGPANFGIMADRLIESTAFHILEEEVSYDYDVDVVFAKTDSPYAYRFDRLRDKLVDDLGKGALIAAYVGHGSYWSFDDVSFNGVWYDIGSGSDLARLRIPAGKPLFFSFTCDTGAFDLPGGRRSIAEQLVMNPEGPIAVFASSRESHPYANALYGAAVVDSFLSGRAPTIGEGLLEVRQHVRQSSIALAELLVDNDIEALKDEHEGLYNLFGDPATHLRYPEAVSVTVKGRGALAPGARIDVALASEKTPTGRALVTVETLRSTIRQKLVSPAAIERMSPPDALAAMAANHAKAVDKVVSKREVDLSGGKATLQVTLPREPGPYVIKAFVAGPQGSAAGHAKLEVTRAGGSGPRASAPSK